ncbi:P pilus assembly protein, pilin FimA [Raoultella terrigena]|uniref:P pilus assembly protein, pilin FimA n=1 Tax=Raoultella terrigena TaxID=577 RepID=A0A3P8M0F3_RAOTE|nr:P pilus assembly protein, pilin FimA [Raoultella terrigena]
MKWTPPRWLVAGTLLMTAFSLQAADVTITVNGKVVAKPCTVSTTHATVDLGDLYTFSWSRRGPRRRGTAWRSI